MFSMNCFISLICCSWKNFSPLGKEHWVLASLELKLKLTECLTTLQVRVTAKMFHWVCKVLLVCKLGVKLPLSGTPVEQRRADGRTGVIKAWLEVRPEGISVM